MIFILGGLGFVGSAFVRYCERKELPYCIINKDNYDAFKNMECDILINADGNSIKYIATENPCSDFVMSTVSVLSSTLNLKFKKYVYISSCDVYENCADPIQTWEDTPFNPQKVSNYGLHKYLSEQIVQHYTKDWLILRCGGFIGPGLKKNGVFDILHGKPLYVDLLSRYQYLPTDNLPEIAFQLIAKGINRETLNVCGRGLISLKDVAEAVPGYQPVYAITPPRLEHYEINLDRVGWHITLPNTTQSVLDFVKSYLGG